MANKFQIAQTKLITPQRRKELLSRPRLLEMMSDLLDFRLIIIAAPAGYGKTSLLIDFASQFDWPICWYALDPLDQDFERFLAYFIHSIKQRFPKFGGSSLKILGSTPTDQINPDFLISTLTNDIYDHITEHFVVVLDDYHLLKSSPVIDQFLSDFIQRADDNCHIVITSRKLLTFPDLPLMVARSQVGGLSIEELAFMPDEIQELFGKIFDKPIDSQQAMNLASRTEGWITGLLLTSQMLKSGMGDQIKVTRTSGVGLYEYLAQQVLDQQPHDIREFMLNTSILEEFNAKMVREVVGKALSQKENWSEMLNHIIQHNLFVLPVDDEYSWVRYHHLFRDFLQSTIKKERPQDVKAIKKKLAEYFTEKEDWERVFEIYSELSDSKAIVQLIQKAGSSYIARGKINKLSEWLDALPDEEIVTNPTILSMKASVASSQSTIQEGKDLLDKALMILRKTNDEENLADNLIRRSATLRLLGDYPAAMADADEAIGITKDNPDLIHLYSEALRAKGVNLLQTGKLADALIFFELAIEICQKSNMEEDIARILVEMGMIYEKMGKYPAAENAYEKSLAYWHSVSDSIWQQTILNNLGVVQHLSGDFSNSFHNFEKALHYAQATGDRRMEGYSLASIGDLYKDLDANNEAVDAYQKAIEKAQQVEDQYLIFYLKMARARMSLIDRQYKKAEMQIRSAQSIAKKSGSSYEINKYRLEQAALDFAYKQYEKASQQLQITTAYFNEAGYIEDGVRSQVLLFLSQIKTGEYKQAEESIKDFLNHIADPDKNIPSLSVLNELKYELKSFANQKNFKTYFSEIFSNLDEYQALTQKNRRKIRKEASVVPFAPARFEIKSFGKAEVTIRNHVLTISDWMTQTSRDLFFMFLAHPEGLTKEEVGLIFWPDSSPAELKLRFKNAIYRMRHAVGSEAVLFQDNFYQFNRTIDYEYDVQSFIAAYNHAKDEKNPAKKKSDLITAINLYSGPYLPDINEIWVVADRQKYFEMYLKAVEDLAGISIENKDYNEGLDFCQQALKYDPCNEEIFRLIMEIYSILGNKAAISKQYEICCKVLKKELNTQPSPQTIDLFNKLVKNPS
jgi:LuxR family maltose regulon positive regulatory protein